MELDDLTDGVIRQIVWELDGSTRYAPRAPMAA